MSYIQLPYGFVKNNKQIQFNLPNNYEENQYIKRLPYITNKGPAVENQILNVLKNREDLKKWLLATSEYGEEIREDLNAIVGYDEKFNNAIVRHALDLKNEAVFHNPNPLNVTFHDVKKFDLVNPVIGKLATQVKASKLTDYELTKKILGQGETDKLQNRFELFKKGLDEIINDDDEDDDENTGSGGIEGGRGRGGGNDGTPPRPLPNLHGRNTPAENSRRIAQANDERNQNRRLRERESETSNILRGIVKSRKSCMDINFPDAPPATPYGGDFIPHPPYSPHEASFLFPDGSLSPLRNRLPNNAPLPSRPSIDNFARPLTRIIDDKSNTVEITPKKPAPKINETNLSKQLQKIFSNVNEVIKEDSNDFKEKIDDSNEILDKIGKGKDGDDQKLFEFEFFTGGKNQKFDKYIGHFGLSSNNLEFLDFLQSDFCKEILENNDLKIHIETGNIYYKNIDTNESIFEFFKNQQNSSKGNIKFDFVYDGNYDNYFRWILNGFDSYKKSKLDVLSYKNIKFLFYCLNDLLNQSGRNIKVGKHSGVTDDYIAAEEIQNQNWQYFIEQVLEVCKDKEIGRTIRKSQDFLLDTVENVTLAKKSYETFYNICE